MGALLTEKVVKAIESCIARGDRAEIVPADGGVQVLRVKRETIVKPPKKQGKSGAK